jgi:hypothetical protein
MLASKGASRGPSKDHDSSPSYTTEQLGDALLAGLKALKEELQVRKFASIRLNENFNTIPHDAPNIQSFMAHLRLNQHLCYLHQIPSTAPPSTAVFAAHHLSNHQACSNV